MDSKEDIRLWQAFEARYGAASKTLRTQARIALEDLCDAEGDVPEATSGWYKLGLSPATITKRLNCLSALGVDVKGNRPRKSTALKWWLNDQSKEFLLGSPKVNPHMKRWIRWTTMTGLRIEENQRLDLNTNLHLGSKPEVTVPGLKTASSQATLPLSNEAAEVLRSTRSHSRGMSGGCWEDMPFDLSYDTLLGYWDECRKLLGVQDVPTATLKSLRRNAARYLHADLGMPLDMVRQYLRHEDIETTMGYLKLVGGYRTNEMRRYLDGSA
jgi:integrase